MGKVNIINETEFLELIKSNKPVLVDFYADWCMPCKMMTPILEEIAEETQDMVKVAKINIDFNENLAIKYQVNAIPYLAVFKNGELVDSKLGLTQKEELMLLLKKHS